MFIYGKMAAHAISVMSYLAETSGRRVSSLEISRVRKLSRPLTAKLLTQLAAAGLAEGRPGPSGGYTLAKPPGDICLFDIVALFGQTEPTDICPFGSGWCGYGTPCPLHDKIKNLLDENLKFMRNNTLAAFEDWPSSNIYGLEFSADVKSDKRRANRLR